MGQKWVQNPKNCQKGPFLHTILGGGGGGKEGILGYTRRGGSVAILNNTLFRVIFHAFLGAVGGVAVEFEGYRKHFQHFPHSDERQISTVF